MDAESSIEEVIQKLSSSNPLPKIINNAPPEAAFPKEYDWVEQKKTLLAWRELHARFDEALPFLTRHLEDSRYSVTLYSRSGAAKNVSVGFVCSYIIMANIDTYERPYVRTSYKPFFESIEVDSTRSEEDNLLKQHGHLAKEIQEWWKRRQKLSVRQMRLEAMGWRICEMRRLLGEQSLPNAERDSIQASISTLERMRRDLKMNGVIDIPSWNDPDEISFEKSP